ncbi:MAG: SpoIID/LytB domain-containing protein [Candidatus Omnitrophota bacterium]
MVKKIICFIFLILFFCISTSFVFSSQIVRVAVFTDVSKITLNINAPFTIETVPEQEVLFKALNLKDMNISIYHEGFSLSTKNFPFSRLEIKRNDKGPINVNGRFFRGALQLIKKVDDKFSVVNFIDLEDYTRGVLYHEISHLWPFETVKAQTVLVRTYALSEMEVNKDKDFDLTSDTYSQVYGGRTSERFRTNKAVENTKGQVLTFNGTIFPTYYHATCGGATEDASALWDIDIVPLKGVACAFCKDSPHFKWSFEIKTKDLEEKLKEAGFKIGAIEKIEILERSSSKRVLKLKISSGKEDIEISGKAFREILGPRLLRSTNFNVQIQDQKAFFNGFGWGHGVGLCQWGAYFMGKKGFSYRQILEYYYPHSKLSKIK